MLVAAYGDRRGYDLAQREGQYAERLRVLCVAVRTIAARSTFAIVSIPCESNDATERLRSSPIRRSACSKALLTRCSGVVSGLSPLANTLERIRDAISRRSFIHKRARFERALVENQSYR